MSPMTAAGTTAAPATTVTIPEGMKKAAPPIAARPCFRSFRDGRYITMTFVPTGTRL